MSEDKNEQIKQKLQQLFDEKLDSLTKKFESDINIIEGLMFTYYDELFIPFNNLQNPKTPSAEV